MNLIKKFLAVMIATMFAATVCFCWIWAQVSLSNYLAPKYGELVFPVVMIVGVGIWMGFLATVGGIAMEAFLDFYKGIGREVQTTKA